jgi:hypothetical protein
MVIVQVLLIASFVAVAFLSLRHRSDDRSQALRIVTVISVGALIATAVLFPGLVTSVAKLVGVGRGADLVLYVVAVVVMYLVVNTHLRMRDLERSITELVRQQALDTAERENRGLRATPRTVQIDISEREPE